MNKLLPCPFCDSQASVTTVFDDSPCYRVTCKNIYSCGVTQHWFDDEEQAISAWNKRVKEDDND